MLMPSTITSMILNLPSLARTRQSTLIGLTPSERVIWGSDAPGRSFASQLGKVLGAEIDEEARGLILGGNLKRMLGPIMKAKGMA